MAKDCSQQTVFHKLAKYENVHMIQHLYDALIDLIGSTATNKLLAEQDKNKNNVLHKAARQHTAAMFTWLLNKDQQLCTMTNNWGQNAAFKAAEQGNLAVLKAIYDKFPNQQDKKNPLLQKDKKDNNILIQAVFSNKTEIAQCLIKNLPQLCTMTDNWNKNAAFTAAEQGNLAVLKDIHQYCSASLGQINKHGNNLLTYVTFLYEKNKKNPGLAMLCSNQKAIILWLNLNKDHMMSPTVQQINVTDNYYYLPGPMPWKNNRKKTD